MKNTTDGTERLLFVSRLRRKGGEAELGADVENDFPAKAFERCGLVGFTAHVGGGYCILEFGFEGAFDATFKNLAKDKEAKAFLTRLGRHVDPAPLIDPLHTADLPLAADQFLWRAETGSASRTPRARPLAGRGAAKPAQGKPSATASKAATAGGKRAAVASGGRSAAATGQRSTTVTSKPSMSASGQRGAVSGKSATEASSQRSTSARGTSADARKSKAPPRRSR